MSILKRFSNSLDNRYFRQQQPGVTTNSVGFNDFLTSPPDVWNHSPIHTSQSVVDASFLMDKRLVDQAARTQNRAITPQALPDHGDLREPVPANDSDRRMCGICDKPPMPESAS
ncbi:hypothetical protein B0D71_27580 [Pseudomonas laurylsulfativorans]|uniref:Uncharacterized protein n=1 Tax=Pseudomonas laurylsulfativorans TaxID=1943631 RepID=A0A2S3VGG0_9PSED|nr:hypothetical protein B0D71_27580 [Pseudomonas laurylsulfativorans]